MRRALWIAAALLAGLGLWWLIDTVRDAIGEPDPIETAYATLMPGSVNGITLFKGMVMERFGGQHARGLRRPHLRDCDLIVHVARDEELPDAEACAWLRSWLSEDSGRQALLVLRDGAVAAWLCRRWGDEAEAQAQRLEAAGDKLGANSQRNDAQRLHARARQEGDREDARSPWMAAMPVAPPGARPGATPDRRVRCPLFELRQVAELPVQRLSGPWAGGGVPPTLRVRAALSATGGVPLLSADNQPVALAVPVGESRLVVVANATALLDGALVDPAARALSGALLDDLANEGASKAAWVHRLAAGGESAPEGLGKLFVTPFVWATAHVLALLLVYLGWKAAWLGRRSPAPVRGLERFGRHIDALAAHLRERQALRPALEAIAEAMGRRIEHEPLTAIDATAIVALWHHPELTAPQRPAAPARQEQA